jgi:thiamine-monophosphate kinase
MSVSELGEFGLINRIAQLLPPTRDDLIAGVGDDVAVVRPSGDRYLLLTSDVQVEGIHFLKDRISAQELGRRIVAVNVSDVASMGGEPRHLLVSLALPRETDVAWVEGLYAGIREAAEGYGLDIVRGNTSRCPDRVVLDAFLLGEVQPELLVRRSGVRPGDALCVTGHPGNAAAGLALLLEPSLDVAPGHAEVVRAAHLTPTARLREGQLIARHGATAMMV